MDPSIIGKKIKTIYPQYKDVDDAILGQKYLSKYGAQVQGIAAGQYPGTPPEKEKAGISLGLTALKESGERVKGTESEEEKKKIKAKEDGDRIITQLEDRYFNGNGGKSLAYGRLKGVLAMGSALAGANVDLNTYLKQLESDKPTFAKAAGDTGNFSKAEQQSAIKQFPTNFSTKEEAQDQFKAIREKFGLRPSLRF